jgi:broad specificity phosphatase PhoE
MYLLVRHAEKIHDNSDNTTMYPLDSDITEGGVELTRLKYSEIISSEVVLRSIISSPYLRARHTAQILSNDQIPITIDVTVSEYLGHQWRQRISPDGQTSDSGVSKRPDTQLLMLMCPETAQYNPPIDRSVGDLKVRARSFLKYMRSNPHNLQPGECVVVVTHGFFMTTIHQMINKGKTKSFKPLGQLPIWIVEQPTVLSPPISQL